MGYARNGYDDRKMTQCDMPGKSGSRQSEFAFILFDRQ